MPNLYFIYYKKFSELPAIAEGLEPTAFMAEYNGITEEHPLKFQINNSTDKVSILLVNWIKLGEQEAILYKDEIEKLKV